MEQKLTFEDRKQLIFVKLMPFLLFAFYIGFVHFEVKLGNLFIINESEKKDFWFFFNNFDATMISPIKIPFLFFIWGTFNEYIRHVKSGEKNDSIDRFFKGFNFGLSNKELPIFFSVLYEIFQSILIFAIFCYCMFNMLFMMTFNETVDLNLFPNGEYNYKETFFNLLIIFSILNSIIILFFKKNSNYKNMTNLLLSGSLFSLITVFSLNVKTSDMNERYTQFSDFILNLPIDLLYYFVFLGLLTIFVIIGGIRLAAMLEKKSLHNKAENYDKALAKRNEIKNKDIRYRTFFEKIRLNFSIEHLKPKETDKLHIKVNKLDYLAPVAFIFFINAVLCLSYLGFKGTLDVNNSIVINNNTVQYRDGNIFVHKSNTPIVESFIEHYAGEHLITIAYDNELIDLSKIAYEYNMHEKYLISFAKNELHYIENKVKNKEHIESFEYGKNLAKKGIKKELNKIFVSQYNYEPLIQFYEGILNGDYQQAVDQYMQKIKEEKEKQDQLTDEEKKHAILVEGVYSQQLLAFMSASGLANVDTSYGRINDFISVFNDFDSSKENIDENGERIIISKADVERIISLFN